MDEQNVSALPARVETFRSEMFPDTRGTERALRVSWHPEAGLVVLSLWREDRCVGTFRLEAGEVPALVNTLVTGLAAASADGWSRLADRDAG